MSLGKGIQVFIYNCDFMNSLLSLTGKIDKQWENVVLNEDPVYIVSFHFIQFFKMNIILN